MRTGKITVVVLLGVFALCGTAMAANITIPDGRTPPIYEDNEVEPGMQTGQIWDLEAFFLKGTKLTMVGGFNFKDGQVGNGIRFHSGDIFINTVGAVNNTDTIPTTGDGIKSIKNTFGFDYAIDLDFVGNKYYVYSLTGDSWLKSTYYRQNDLSNPWEFDTSKNGSPVPYFTGTLVYDPSVDSTEIHALWEDSTKNLLGWGSDNRHYGVTIDLGFLPAETTFTSHFTMECGNDLLMGSGTTPVPEPGTMMLLGSGLVGLAGWGRKKFRR